MIKPTTRTIDELGRVVLPMEFRRHQGWGAGDEVALSCENDTIVLKLSSQYSGPVCIICKKGENKVNIRGRGVCDCCFTDFQEA